MFLKPKVREESWPRIFVYKTATKFWSTAFTACYLVGIPIYFALDPKVQAGFRRNWATRGPAVALEPPMVVAALLLLGLVVNLPRMKLWLETFQSGTETIEVTPEGLTWRSGAGTRVLPWVDVSSFTMHPSGLWQTTTTFEVEGSAGRIQWRDNIDKLSDLMKLTQSFATSAPIRHWTNPKNRRGTIPGEAIFSYRQFSWLKLLLLWSLMDIVLLLPSLLTRKGITGSQDDIVIFMMFYAPAIWCWWRYFNARVSLRPDGIRHATAFGERFMPWPEVRDAEIVGPGEYKLLRIRGTASTLWIVPTTEWTEELRDTVNARVSARMPALRTPLI